MNYVHDRFSGTTLELFTKHRLRVLEFRHTHTEVGKTWQSNGRSINPDHYTAMELGINLFDTANRYTGGEAEEILGKAVKGRRHEVLLATKCAGELGDGPNSKGQSRAHIMAAVLISLLGI